MVHTVLEIKSAQIFKRQLIVFSPFIVYIIKVVLYRYISLRTSVSF